MDVSIVICTRNRASSLNSTLHSLQNVYVPPNLDVELVVVDNGSTDSTAEVVWETEFPRMESRLVTESKQGVSRARNKALREGTGDVLLFTDDDVRLPEDWIDGMTAPIRSGTADAVAGGVKLAPHLRRSWMDEVTTGFLAETKDIDPESPDRMVGANMAFARHVTERVPGFDPALGPGALEMEEETLFSYQLLEAGYDLVSAFDVEVEHHCDPSRLTRVSLIEANEKTGRSQGYVAYHGVKLHVVAQERNGTLPLLQQAGLTPGSEKDLRALRRVLPTIEGGVLCGDKAYWGGPLKEQLAEDQDLDLLTPVKKNKGQKTLSAADALYSEVVSRMRQWQTSLPASSLFSTKSTRRPAFSRQGLLVHAFGRLAAAMLLLALNP